MRLRPLSLLVSFLLAGQALGQAAAQTCEDFAQQASFAELDIARVKTGVAKVPFESDCVAIRPGACPKAKAYVIPGDVVVMGRRVDDSVCAVFVDPKGHTTSGLLPRERLEQPVPKLLNLPVELIGVWQRTEAKIEVKRRGADGVLSFNGDATYGALDKGRVKRGAVNMGEFAFDKKPLTNAVSSPTDKQTECHVAMLALGPYLVVEDNRLCGGNNVSFTGIYRRGK